MKKRKQPNALAKPGDPLITEQGMIVYEDSPVDKERQKQHTVNASNFAPKKKRNLKELPGPVSLINAIGCVFMYTTLGVGDREIMDALKITSIELKQIKSHSAYDECFEIVTSAFIDANSDLLSSRIAAYSHMALTSVADIAKNAKKDDVRMRAAGDLLDRAGVAPKENANRQSKQDGLRIIISDGDKHVGIELNGETVR